MTLYGEFENGHLVSGFYAAEALVFNPDGEVKELCSLHHSHAVGQCDLFECTSPRDAALLQRVLSGLKESA